MTGAKTDDVDLAASKSSIFWPEKIAVSGLIVGLFFSLVLFTGDGRTLPLCPLIHWQHPLIVDRLLYDASILALMLVLFNLFKPWSTGLLFLSIFILILFDLNRFQPWVYEYLVIILLANLPENKSQGEKLKAVSVFICAIYFFTGMQKINWRFITSIGPWLLGYSQSTNIVHDNYLPLMLAGLTMPLGEIVLAFTLYFKRTRRLGLIMGLVMHGIILWEIGPDRFNINAAVWPWNITQIALILACFGPLRPAKTAAKNIESTGNEKKLAVVLAKHPVSTALLSVVSLIVPVLGLLQIADAFPSYAFYTGDVPNGSIYFQKSMIEKMAPYLHKTINYDPVSKLWVIDIVDWALIETGTAVYPSKFCLFNMASNFAADHPGEEIIFKLKIFPKLTKNIVTTTYRLSAPTN